jgi:glycosyltransferase involved in cell wall biosynthesis
MQEQNPLISIIIPIYNTEKWIPDCIESVLAQTYTNFEIICVNDASPDGSLELLNNYAMHDNRIIVISHPTNKSTGAAYNTGIKHAKGEYIKVLDSDDYLSIDCLQNLVNAALKYKSDVIVGGVSIVTKHKKQIGTRKSDKIYANINPIEYPELSWLSTGLHWAMLIKRKILIVNSIHYFECRPSSDAYFLFSLIWFVKDMTIIPTITHCYRQISTSTSNSMHDFKYLYTDFKAYAPLFECAIMQKDYTKKMCLSYSTHRFMYRIMSFFCFDLRYSIRNLSDDEQEKLFELLCSYFKQYNLGILLSELYIQQYMQTFGKTIKALLTQSMFVHFLTAMQSGNIELCINIAKAISYKVTPLSLFEKNVPPLSKFNFIMKLLLFPLKLRAIIFHKYKLFCGSFKF